MSARKQEWEPSLERTTRVCGYRGNFNVLEEVLAQFLEHVRAGRFIAVPCGPVAENAARDGTASQGFALKAIQNK